MAGNDQSNELAGIDGVENVANGISDELPSGETGGNPEPVKRGRGRPRKDTTPIDPAGEFAGGNGSGTAGTGGSDTGTGRGRGRPRKSDAPPNQAAITAFARKIMGVHYMAAMALKIPELAISEEEARELADATLLVGREYGVKMNGKTAATLNLVATAAVIYGPKLVGLAFRPKIAPAPKSSPEKSPVMPSATASAAKAVFNPSGPIQKPDWAK